MNPYALRRQHLKLVRLPISPPPLWGELYEYIKGPGILEPSKQERLVVL